MLVGRPAFTGHNSIAVVRRKLDEEAPPLDAFRPGLPPEVTALVAELLERDPGRRPQSAQQVQQRLQALLASCTAAEAPTTVIPSPPRTRLMDVTRREPPGLRVPRLGQGPGRTRVPGRRGRGLAPHPVERP
jgi:serine/threonine protein kinase